MSAFLLIALVCMLAGTAYCQCEPGYCQRVNCSAEPHRPPCGEDERLESFGTYCGCCSACVTNIHVGQRCKFFFSKWTGPPSSQCARGLACVNGRCVSQEPRERKTTLIPPQTDDGDEDEENED
ncbi:uncharacterized protein [Periplaneta americana]|uniref:uncharacterized protein n=1 Tax=Periplaneta americana TaxID=6978 RepID=UPI0037E75739